MKKTIALTTLLGLFVLASTSAQSIDNKHAQTTANSTHNPNKVKWLGVSLTNLSDAMHSQLGQLLDAKEGILIKDIQANSPAEKAGLQSYDILTQFNGQKVTSSQQVYNLVQETNPQQETTLEIIRGGKKHTILAKIGTREVTRKARPSLRSQQGGFPQFNNQFFNTPNWQEFSMPNFPVMPNNFTNNSQNNSQSWSQSESFSIKTLEDDKVRAEIKTKDTNGNEKSFVFEDKRDIVIRQIKEQRDLPDNQKKNLINSLQSNSTMNFNQNLNQNFFNKDFLGNKWHGFPQQKKFVY